MYNDGWSSGRGKEEQMIMVNFNKYPNIHLGGTDFKCYIHFDGLRIHTIVMVFLFLFPSSSEESDDTASVSYLITIITISWLSLNLLLLNHARSCQGVY